MLPGPDIPQSIGYPRVALCRIRNYLTEAGFGL